MGNHTSDCATVMYAHLDPGQLKKPLICDCGASDPPGSEMPIEADDPWNAAEVARNARSKDAPTPYRLTIEGAAASAVFRLKVAKAEYDAALRAVVEELTR